MQKQKKLLRTRYRAVCGIAFATMLLTQAAIAGPIAYSLGNGGTTLLRFEVANPAGVSSIVLSTSLDAIDFRPLTGQMYGYVDASDEYYVVDPVTGVATLFTTAPVASTSSSGLGIDFNPTIDRMRTVTIADENIVYNPLTGGTTAVTNLFYIAGDANEGVDPNITANGYTNSFAGATTTTQYVLDSGTNTLATLGNNTGQLTTIGALTLGGLPFDFSSDSGLDILFANGPNIAYALLNVNAQSGLYSINLGNGEAALLGNLPTQFGTARGLAVEPIPEPSSLALMLVGLASVATVRRRRRHGSAEGK